METSLAPGLLIAVPQLLDPNFRQTVVLLLQQTDEGALGIVINRESPLRLAELCHDHEISYEGDPEKLVRVGGPVQPQQGLVLYSAEHDDPEGHVVSGDLHLSASTDTLSRLCGLTRGRFHCYSGYAGWGPGQLEREIRDGSWIMASVDPALVLDADPEEIWVRAYRDNGMDPSAVVPGSGEAC